MITIEKASSEQFAEVLKQFDTGILVTANPAGSLHGRPMVVAQVADNSDLWFITGWDTPKTGEIRANESVEVSFQNAKRQYVSVSGTAEMSRDQAKIDELWQADFDPWFKNGKTDPNVALIQVSLTRGQFWDEKGVLQLESDFEG